MNPQELVQCEFDDDESLTRDSYQWWEHLYMILLIPLVIVCWMYTCIRDWIGNYRGTRT